MTTPETPAPEALTDERVAKIMARIDEYASSRHVDAVTGIESATTAEHRKSIERALKEAKAAPEAQREPTKLPLTKHDLDVIDLLQHIEGYSIGYRGKPEFWSQSTALGALRLIAAAYNVPANVKEAIEALSSEAPRELTDDIYGFSRRQVSNALDLLDSNLEPEAEFLTRFVRTVLRAVLSSEAPVPQPGRSPVCFMCPACACLWRDNEDGTMSLFNAKQKSCVVCENSPLSKLHDLYDPEAEAPVPQSEMLSRSDFIANCIALNQGSRENAEVLADKLVREGKLASDATPVPQSEPLPSKWLSDFWSLMFRWRNSQLDKSADAIVVSIENHLRDLAQTATPQGEPFGWFYELNADENPKAGPVYLGTDSESVTAVVAADENAKPFPLYCAPPSSDGREQEQT